jgi:peptidoglycan/xylan/chitin deacetylase (PgdA/CDA1 family)
MGTIHLRMDDIGASTKKYEVYSKTKFGNILFFKYLKPFKAWGPYPEISAEQWQKIFELLNDYDARLTIGVTASWVERNGSLIPFPEKFPSQSELIKKACQEKLIEIANHGLTHCVVGKNLPKMFTSNRKYHREFWDWVPREVHFENLEKSQEIFRQWLGSYPTTFIPPGNVYSIDTLEAAEKYGIKRINSYINHYIDSKVHIINNDKIDAFHDRELVLEGVEWLGKKLAAFGSKASYLFIRDIK